MLQNLDTLKKLQRDYGTADWSQWNAQRTTFYDYIRYSTGGTTALSFLTIQQGGTDPVSGNAKTLEECNIPKNRSFGQVYFAINEIRSHVQILPKVRQPSGISGDTSALFGKMANMMSKLDELLRRGVLTIQLNQRTYVQIEQPFKFCPPGFGVNLQNWGNVFDASNTAGLNRFGLYVQQNSSDRNNYQLTPFQLIEPETSIEATVNFDTNSPAFTGLVDSVDVRIQVGLIFDGYLIRASQ